MSSLESVRSATISQITISKIKSLIKYLKTKQSQMKNIIYLLSLIVLATAIFLIIEYPESGRIQVIAGAVLIIGFTLNVFGFLFKVSANKN
jgi:hypothetical protein